MKRIIACLLVVIMLVSTMGAHQASAATTKVALNKTKLSLEVGGTYTLKLTGATNGTKWSTSDKKIVTVTNKGLVSAIAMGSATITAKVKSKKYTCKITVTDKTVTITFSYFEIDRMSLDEYLEILMDDIDPSILKAEKVDDTHFALTMYESYRLSTLKEIEEEDLEKTVYEQARDEFSNMDNVLISINTSNNLDSTEIYVDKSIYDEKAAEITEDLSWSILFMYDIYSALQLIDLNDRHAEVHIYDNTTKEELKVYQY